jgi:hypothetical protein
LTLWGFTMSDTGWNTERYGTGEQAPAGGWPPADADEIRRHVRVETTERGVHIDTSGVHNLHTTPEALAEFARGLTAGDGWITEPPGPEINTSARLWGSSRGGQVDAVACWLIRERWNLDPGFIAWQPYNRPAPYVPQETP